MTVLVPPRQLKTVVYLTDDTPVHHIVGLQYLHTQEMEVGSYHIVLVVHANDVRVAEVGIQHRILVGTVQLVTPVERMLG